MTKQRGLLTYIDISDLDKGYHEIKISLPKKRYGENIIAKIPFYKEEIVTPHQDNKSDKEDDKSDSYLEYQRAIPK
jgi:hypothetical protein